MSVVDRLQNTLQDLEILRDPAQVAKLSQDYFHFSPLLQNQLGDKVGEVVIRPRSEAEAIRVAAAAVAEGLPLTVRGAGTGNYGQCIPLQGGIILDMSLMTEIEALEPGWVKVAAGAKLSAIDRAAREQGWELRMMPSTYRTATIGGFIAGGSGGIGSINYGFLGDRGNIGSLRLVTLEDPPQVLTLRGDEVQKAIHAYGTTGIITAVEMPLAPAYPWVELAIGFATVETAATFCQTVAESDGLVKKLISLCEWPIPSYFAALQSWLEPGETIVFLLMAPHSVESLPEAIAAAGGQIRYQKSALETGRGLNVLEYTWNHTTLHARAADPQWTYLQTLYPNDRPLEGFLAAYHHFRDRVVMHGEWIRHQGRIWVTGLPLVRYTTAAALQQLMADHEDQGTLIFNPHTYFLEEGGRKTVDPVQLAFKQQTDPYGLLNPGKMKAYRSPRQFSNTSLEAP